ncbi:hypothetical protein J2TS4_10430 [Paenibacillus sp. J2TS4]|nr:hypothetical protein J2TS4_10430 [Paenibacillus sp. J2TS4]
MSDILSKINRNIYNQTSTAVFSIVLICSQVPDSITFKDTAGKEITLSLTDFRLNVAVFIGENFSEDEIKTGLASFRSVYLGRFIRTSTVEQTKENNREFEERKSLS